MPTKFNINWVVKVKLTPIGRKIHKENYEHLYKNFPELQEKYPYKAPEEDAEGYSRWQMWELMKDFGMAMSLGMNTPFETEIILEDQHF